MIAFIGVRISWLVAARNALLAAFACSATSRASSASWNSRAFWIAAPTFAAIVESSRVSASPKSPRVLALDADHADRLRPDHDGHTEVGPDGRPDRAVESLERLLLVQQERGPALEDLRGQPDAVGERLLRLLQPVFDVVGELDHVGALIVQGHVDDVGLERRTQLVAEAFDQDVEPQLLGDRLADVVHDRQLGRVLTRLLEQPGVLERDAQAPRDGGRAGGRRSR